MSLISQHLNFCTFVIVIARFARLCKNDPRQLCEIPMAIGLNLAPQHRVYAGFCLHAITMGSIFPRMPDIKQAMNIGEGALGLSLIGVPTGTLLALAFATPFVERLGFRRTLLSAIPLVALTYAIAIHAIGPQSFFALLIPVGFLIGCVEIVLNVEADRTEALIKRRIMNRSHSFWSIGFFSAGLFGAAMAHLGVTPQVQLAILVPIIVVAVALLLGKFQPAPTRSVETGQDRPKFALPTWPVLVLVAVTMSAMIMEGAGIDWSAIYMRTLFSSGPFIAGVAVAVVALSQAIGRFFADGFVETHSPSSVARFLAGIMLAGVIMVFFSPAPAISLTGFALIGLGTSVMFPLGVSAAAQMTDRPSAINVASFVQIAFVMFLIGPPLLGGVAEHWGIRWAFGIGAPLAVLSLLTASTLGNNSRAEVVA
jgi:MFS family permease